MRVWVQGYDPTNGEANDKEVELYVGGILRDRPMEF